MRWLSLLCVPHLPSALFGHWSVNSLCEVQAPFFHQDVKVLGVAFWSYTIPRQLEPPVEVRGFMIVRLTDQRLLHLVLLGQLIIHPQQVVTLATAQEIVHMNNNGPIPSLVDEHTWLKLYCVGIQASSVSHSLLAAKSEGRHAFHTTLVPTSRPIFHQYSMGHVDATQFSLSSA